MPEFIPNIDDANTRITQLESQLNREPSGFIDCIDDANNRVAELEAECLKRGSKGDKPPAKAQATTRNLTGLNRAIAANGGPVLPNYEHKQGLAKGEGLARAIAANARKQS